MTLDEVHWVGGHPCAMQARLETQRGAHLAWLVYEGCAYYAGYGRTIELVPGTYTFRSCDGEEWINLEPLEAQCVLNHLVGGDDDAT
jgi:hypothetical protein